MADKTKDTEKLDENTSQADEQFKLNPIDISKAVAIIEDGDTNIVILKSTKNGRPTRLTGIPQSVKFDRYTEVYLGSEEGSHSKIDSIKVCQKDRNGNVTSEETYIRDADGKFKKQEKKKGQQKSQNQPIILPNEPTYTL